MSRTSIFVRSMIAIMTVALVITGFSLAMVQTAEAGVVPTVTVKRVNTGTLTMKKGTSYKLGATASAGKLTYKSSKPKIVSVTKKGKLKALKTGKSKITIKAVKGSTATTKIIPVTVVKAGKYKKVKTLTATATSCELLVGDTTKMTAAFKPSKASNKNVIFKSNDTAVITVTAAGKVTAKAEGTATVKVTSCDNSKAYDVVSFYVYSMDDDPTASDDPIPGIAVRSELKEYSWDELKAISASICNAASDEEGLEIAKEYNLTDSSGILNGDTKPVTLTDGRKGYVRILGFRHDELVYSEDRRPAGISFEFANIVAAHSMTSSSNEGGWIESNLRSWLNDDSSGFLSLLPDDLRACVADVRKLTNNKGQLTSSDTSAVWGSGDFIWLLSMSEVFGNLSSQSEKVPNYPGVYDAEGTQYQLYADQHVTTSNYDFCSKTPVSGVSYYWWWLRSPYVNNDYAFHIVQIAGDWNWVNANYTGGVSPCFCI